MQPGNWGWGVALATTYGAGFGRFEGAMAYVPLSIHLTDSFTTHYNLGVSHESGGDGAVIWGIGGELAAAVSVDVIAEIHGTHQGGTQLQAGLRYHLGNGALDVSYGFARADRSDNWVTLGFVWDF